jgi:preprotein translocase subunit Sec61beta
MTLWATRPQHIIAIAIIVALLLAIALVGILT